MQSKLNKLRYIYFLNPKQNLNSVLYICVEIFFMNDVIVNKVAESSLITIDLEDFFPKQEEIKIFDLKDFLFMGLILKEKEYRTALQQTDWSIYESKYVAITCTADAIIPMWANMLAVNYLQPVAKDVVFGDEKKLIEIVLQKQIEAIDANEYYDKRIVVKGCGEVSIPEVAYVAITKKLRPVVKSIMYGEPCSTVPIYKKK